MACARCVLYLVARECRPNKGLDDVLATGDAFGNCLRRCERLKSGAAEKVDRLQHAMYGLTGRGCAATATSRGAAASEVVVGCVLTGHFTLWDERSVCVAPGRFVRHARCAQGGSLSR